MTNKAYLQGDTIRLIQKYVRACMKRWPDINRFAVEARDRDRFFNLNAETLRRFVRTGLF